VLFRSTIIQALTGCESRGYRGKVKDRLTKKWITVIASSPEETNISKQKLSAMTRAAATSKSSLGMVIALQPNHPSRRLSIEDILRISSRYPFVRHMFVISRAYKGYGAISAQSIEKRLSKFTFRKPLQPLDARRFGHINASAIRDIVGWF